MERHPWQPFIPCHTRVIFLGSFPPAPHRWAMDFFYPNYINDMWRIFGICLYGDPMRFVDEQQRTFRLDDIQTMLKERGVGLYDTATVVRRTRNTASDKDLEVLEITDFDTLLRSAPECCAVVTTGQKATDLFAAHYGLSHPAMGQYVEFPFDGRSLRFYRMPSSSRAYPMRLAHKAEAYQPLFDEFIKSKKS